MKPIFSHIPQCHLRKASGITLIEVLVTVAVIGIGLLGLAGLQARALRDASTAMIRSQATSLGQELADRIRANPNGGDNYELASTDAFCAARDAGSVASCTSAVCTAAQQAAADLHKWAQSVDARVLHGVATVRHPADDTSTADVDESKVWTIMLFWDEDRDPERPYSREDCSIPGDATPAWQVSFRPWP